MSNRFRDLEDPSAGKKKDIVLMAAVSGFESLTRPTREDYVRFSSLFPSLFENASVETRRTAAAALSRLDHVPDGIVELIVNQPVEIAAPFISHYENLSEATLARAIGRHGAGHARAAARRSNLSHVGLQVLWGLKDESVDRALKLRGLTIDSLFGAEIDIPALDALENYEDADNKWVKSIHELMQAVDDYIDIPEREIDLPFLMPVEDVFGIKGRGTVVTGRIERGIVKTGDPIEIVGFGNTVATTVTGVEMFHKTLEEGQPGDAVGCLIRGIEREDVSRGAVLAKPKSITPSTKAKAQVYVLTKEEGGRHTPFFPGYKPQFYIRTTDVTGDITLNEGVEMVMPGDNTVMNIELMYPVALEENLRFAIREGGRTVGSGVFIEIEG
mgnify:CR=1 FL=1